jgi:hypothetical protein
VGLHLPTREHPVQSANASAAKLIVATDGLWYCLQWHDAVVTVHRGRIVCNYAFKIVRDTKVVFRCGEFQAVTTKLAMFVENLA